MSLDTTKLSTTALDLIESLAAQYEGSDESPEVGEVALVVELDLGDQTEIAWRCTDPRRWAQHGLLSWVLGAIRRGD